MTMAFKMNFNVVVFVLFLAWIITCLEIPIDEPFKDVCNDTLPDCANYDSIYKKNACARRDFALIACRKFCGLCNECIIPSKSEHPQNGKLILIKDDTKDETNFKLSYKCDEGFYPSSGNLTRTCNKGKNKGEWSGSKPVCSPVLGRNCSENATCEEFLNGTSCIDRKCSCSLNYSQSQQKCFKDCGNVSLPIVRTTGGDNKYKSVAEVRCTEGYYNANATTNISKIICSANGEWTEKPTCLRKDCGNISDLNHKNIDAHVRLHNDTRYKSTADVDCVEGYYNTRQNQTTGISTTIMTCSRNGTWINKPTCEAKDCGPLEHLDIPHHDLLLLFSGTKFGETGGTITCKAGYYDGRKTSQPESTSSTLISCGVNGTWSNLPNCTRKDCGNVHNISIDYAANRRVHNDTKYKSTADIDCDEGYYIKDQQQPTGISNTTITCSKKGTWDDVPTCILKDCGDVNNIGIANATNRRVHNGTTYKSTADIDCDEGYYIQGQQQPIEISTRTITCSKSGKWENMPTCIPKDCGKLDNITMSNADNRSVINGTSYTSVATVSCNVGYKDDSKNQSAGIDSKLIRCNGSGSWDNLPNCIMKDCGPVENLNLKNTSAPRLLNNNTKYGATSNVSCLEGYYDKNKSQTTAISTTTILCSEEGQWIHLPLCVRKDCGPLKNLTIPNANNRTLMPESDTKFRSTATIHCDIGYNKNGENQTAGISSTEILCDKTGNWSNVPRCVKKDCGKLDAPTNGNITVTNTTYNSTATYSCHTGYYINGTETVTCLANGHWSSNTTKCHIKDCRSFNAPGNGSITFFQNKTVYGSNATFNCNSGYKMIGPETIQCNASGQWSNETTHCEIKDCGSPMKLENGNFTHPNGTKFSASALYECNPGYTLHGSNSTKCLDTGEWKNISVTCKKNTCNETKDITNITNGKYNGTSSHASYTCNPGYTLHGNATLYCLLNGSWNTRPPTCNVTVCKMLENPNNGTVTVGNLTYNSTATFSCNDGYYLTDNRSSVCNASGYWSIIPKCKIKDCHNLIDPQHGHVDQGNGTTYLSVSTYRCDTGYTLNGYAIRTCNKDGVWDNTNVTCSIKDCLHLTYPKNGYVDQSNGTTYLSVSTYSCDAGYTLKGNNTATCIKDGKWDNLNATCVINDCGQPRNISNGNVSITNGTKYNSFVTYTCNEGYYTNDSTTRYCQANKTWNGTAPTCTIKDCGQPPKPNNGSVTTINSTTYLSKASYSCEDGFDLNGTDTRVCQANKSWSLALPTCDIRNCDEPRSPDHGSVNTTNGTTYSSQITFSCDPGYNLDGSVTAFCQANKTWSSVNQSCKIKNCGAPNSTANGTILSKSGNLYNDNATYSCNLGYETAGTVFITCNSSGKWSSPPPVCKDINECARYTDNCHIRAQCTNTDGSYTCKCDDGFRDVSTGGMPGRNCEDINECANETYYPCNRKGSQCVNYNGGFVCVCNEGWTGKGCENDIDECNKTSACGVEANCTNYEGGYNCTCHTNFPKGNPKIHCYENVIIHMETHVVPIRGDNEIIDAKPIQNRIPYFGTEYNSFRPSMNGFVTLGYQPLYEDYGAESSSEWKTFSNGHTVIAPYWTNLDSTNLTGGLYVHLLEYYTGGKNDSLHRDLRMLGEQFSKYLNLTDFNPRVAIVATWKSVTKSSYIIPERLIKSQNATMQVILISNGVHTYVMFNYDHEQWSLIKDKGIPSSAGFSLKDHTGYIIATSKNASQLNKETNLHPGPNGRWIFDVTDNDSHSIRVLQNESECLQFSKNGTIRNWIAKKRALSYACPCSKQQMELDYSYHTVEPMYKNSHPKPICYEAWFFNNDGVKQTCCYSYGALKKDSTGGGFATFEIDPYNVTQYFYKCCDPTTDRHLCHLFYEMNPSDDCSRFNPADEPIGRNRRSIFDFWNSGSCLESNILHMVVLLVFAKFMY